MKLPILRLIEGYDVGPQPPEEPSMPNLDTLGAPGYIGVGESSLSTAPAMPQGQLATGQPLSPGVGQIPPSGPPQPDIFSSLLGAIQGLSDKVGQLGGQAGSTIGNIGGMIGSGVEQLPQVQGAGQLPSFLDSMTGLSHSAYARLPETGFNFGEAIRLANEAAPSALKPDFLSQVLEFPGGAQIAGGIGPTVKFAKPILESTGARLLAEETGSIGLDAIHSLSSSVTAPIASLTELAKKLGLKINSSEFHKLVSDLVTSNEAMISGSTGLKNVKKNIQSILYFNEETGQVFNTHKEALGKFEPIPIYALKGHPWSGGLGSISQSLINVASKRWASGRGDIVSLTELATDMGTTIKNPEFMQSLHQAIIAGDVIGAGSRGIPGKTLYLTEKGLTTKPGDGYESIVTAVRIPGLETPEAAKAFFTALGKSGSPPPSIPNVPLLSAPKPINMSEELVRLAPLRHEQDLINAANHGDIPSYLKAVDAAKSVAEVQGALGELSRTVPKVSFQSLAEKMGTVQQMEKFGDIAAAAEANTINTTERMAANIGLSNWITGNKMPQPAQLAAMEKVWPGTKTILEAAEIKPIQQGMLDFGGQPGTLTPYGGIGLSGKQVTPQIGMESGGSAAYSEILKMLESSKAQLEAAGGALSKSQAAQALKAKIAELQASLDHMSTVNPLQPGDTTPSLTQLLSEGKSLNATIPASEGLGALDLSLSTKGVEDTGILSSIQAEQTVKSMKEAVTTGPLFSSLMKVGSTIVEKKPIDWLDAILSIWNIPKVLAASIDLSAGRQAAVEIALHPINGVKALVIGVRSYASKAASEAIVESIKLSPYNDARLYQKNGRTLIQDANLDITGVGKEVGVAGREEAYASTLVDKIPLVAASARAFTNMLDYLRITRFTAMAKEMEKNFGVIDFGTREIVKDGKVVGTVPIKEYHDLADYVNKVTGRGNLGYRTENIIKNGKIVGTKQVERGGDLLKVLNSGIFSPKLILSRLQTPFLVLSKNPVVRKEAAKSLAAFSVENLLLLTALKESGIADVELDMGSADFGKIRIGKQRLDPWGGYQQYLVLAARLLTGQTKSQAGNILPTDRAATLTRFLRTKAAPTPGEAIDLLSGRNVIGEKTDLTSVGQAAMDDLGLTADDLPPVGVPGLGVAVSAWNFLGPMFVGDFIEAFRLEGAKGAALSLPVALGWGGATYEPSPGAALKTALDKAAGVPWDTLSPKEQIVLRKSNPDVKAAEAQNILDKAKNPITQIDSTEQIDASKAILGQLRPDLQASLKSSGLLPTAPMRNINIPGAADYHLNDDNYKRYQQILVDVYNKIKLPAAWETASIVSRKNWFDNIKEIAGEKARLQLLKELNTKPVSQPTSSIMDKVGPALGGLWEQSLGKEMATKIGEGDIGGAGLSLASVINPGVETARKVALGEPVSDEEIEAGKGLAMGMAGSMGTPMFYSKLGSVVEVAKVNKAQGMDWLRFLKGQGVKDTELQATGIEEVLKNAKGLTKQELMDAFDVNQVRVEEVVKGTNLEDSLRVATERFAIDQSPENMERLVDIQSRIANGAEIPRFQDFQLPGGGDYTELLLTMPQKSISSDAISNELFGKSYEFLNPRQANDVVLEMRREQQPAFVGAHYDEPNILVHIRFNIRTDINGKKTLFVEEIQSDWAQRGRGQFEVASELKKYGIDNPVDKRMTPQFMQEHGVPDDLQTRWSKEFPTAYENNIAGKGIIPKTPFAKTEDWTSLAAKRLMKYAADEGYDQIAWTTGRQQAARYPGIEEKGMIGYYDNIVPAVFDKLGKQYGVRVSETKIETGSKGGEARYIYNEGVRQSNPNYGTYEAVHAIDVRPNMKQPQPLFMLIPPIQRPEEQGLLDQINW